MLFILQALLVILTEAQQPGSQIEIVAITSVAGNVDVAAVTVNIGRVLEVFEEAHPGVKAPPLFTGCDVPIVQPPSRATEWHGTAISMMETHASLLFTVFCCCQVMMDLEACSTAT
jgi:inosine-uridine nucleoside N-ribohydrolase